MSDSKTDRPVYTVNGATPVLGRGVFVAPTAAVTGAVTIGDGSSIWFSAVVRGDEEPVTIGRDTNVQDGAVIHSSKGEAPTVIGDRVTIGHGAILHGCRIEDDAMIGMGAVVLDGAKVERGGMVAAAALVAPGKTVPAGQLWVGNPGAVRRPVRAEETAGTAAGVQDYVHLADQHLAAGIGRSPPD